MRDKIIPYHEMCRQQEQSSLQRGMNYRLRDRYSVILMSVRPNAPYRDVVAEEGAVIIYEGHDVPRTKSGLDPKLVDQPEFLPSGSLTQNGKFHRAAEVYKAEKRDPDLVRVYEKIKQGIWSDNGYFHLVDSWIEHDGTRQVFKFKLIAVAESEVSDEPTRRAKDSSRGGRVIPTKVKVAVWQRDGGKCRVCGAPDDLHFDHVIPFSKGGTSTRVENIQLLCGRHNIQKSARIE